MDLRTVGVEEEFLLVEREGGHPRAVASAVLRAARGKLGDPVAAEMQLEQVETETQPCVSLNELGVQIRAARQRVAASARAVGVEIAASGTSPVPVAASLTPTRRYERMAGSA